MSLVIVLPMSLDFSVTYVPERYKSARAKDGERCLSG